MRENTLNSVLKILFYFCLFSIVVGALVKLPPVPSVINIYMIDLAAGGMFVVWLFNSKEALKIVKGDRASRYFLLFVLIGLGSLVFSPLTFSFKEKVIAFLYLLRFFSYFSIYITVKHLVQNKLLTSERLIMYLGVVGVALAFLGWLQYMLYPDLRNLYYLGFDPHYKRFFASFFDPNYLGLLLTLSLIALFAQPSTAGTWILRSMVYLAFAFTYSRSSFIALIMASFVYSVLKKQYLVLWTTILILSTTIFMLPRPGGVGVQLERTFSIVERFENGQRGLSIFLRHPLLGVGFNAVRYAKRKYGFTAEKEETDHAGAGFDNSFITVAVTTGILGLSVYLLFLRKLFQQGSLFARITLAAIITHSLFVNSLFLPWVMAWMWIAENSV